nr:uncharacterized protein LOC112039619 [Quercus suber]
MYNGIYTIVIKADQDIVSVNVPESVSGDVAGNKNQPSKVLEVMHYSVPKISTAFSGSTTGSFAMMVIAAGLLKVSIASFHSTGEISSRFPSLSQPESNLFGIACHLQVIALSGWLAVRLPVEYYELTRGLRWSIPYISLPWERKTGHTRLPANTHMSKIHVTSTLPKKPLSDPKDLTGTAASLAAVDYGQSLIKKHPNISTPHLNCTLLPNISTPHLNSTLHPNISTPHLNCTLHPRISDNGWSDFRKNMFWLVIIGGVFISVHALLLLFLKLKNKNSEMQRDYGVLTLPKLEIVIVNLALPCICQASAAIVRGITFAALLQYKEVRQEGQGFPWYQKIAPVFLVSVEEGEWTPKKPYVTILESLYKDYRGPPKAKLSQISGGSSHTQGADDKTEDAEAPFIQKLFGKLKIYYTLLESVIQKLCGELRIYYPLLESVRRVLLAIMAGLYEDNPFSKIPTRFSLWINCFHLFFLVLEKPFIEKNIQLLEIMAVSSEACISAIMFVLGGKKLSAKDGKKFGILMLIIVLVGILPRIMNELYTLYKQIKHLDSEKHSFLTGLKTAASGLTSLFSSKKFSLRRPPALKDNIADSNSKPTSVADEDTATSTSTSNQVKSPNQDRTKIHQSFG